MRATSLAPSLSITALIGLGLSACASPGPLPSPPASSGAPVPTPGYDWHLNHDGNEASLSYGMAETDDVPLNLSCQASSRRLTILLNTEKGVPHRIALESGGDTETYRASAEPSPLSDGLDLTATASASDPVFKRFRQLGWLAVNTGQARRALVAAEGSLPQVQRFFEICDPSR